MLRFLKTNCLFMVLAVLALVACDPNTPDTPQGGNQQPTDTIGGGTNPTDTIIVPGDTIITPTDTIITPPDTIVSPKDTTYTASDHLLITYSGSSASVVGLCDGVEADVQGGDVVITSSVKGLQIIATGSGTGSLKVYSTYKYQLALQSLTLESTTGPAINNQGKKTLSLLLDGTSSLTDGSSYDSQNAAGEDQKAAFFSEGQIVVSGAGSLNINARKGNAMVSDDYIILTAGTLNLTTTADAAKALKANDYITVEGGTVVITQSGGTTTENNDINHCTAIKADSTVTISGGQITINSSAKGGRGIRSGQQMLIAGGNVKISMTGEGSESSSGGGGRPGGGPGGWGGGGGGSTSSSIKGKGIRADGALLMTGGEVEISTTGTAFEAVESKTSITLQGGRLYAISQQDDAINCSGMITFSGAWVYAISNGNDAVDSNYGRSGAITIKEGVVVALSAAGSPEEGLDCDNNSYITIQGGYVLSAGGSQGGGGGWGGSSGSSSSVGSASQAYCFTSGYNIQNGTYYTVCNNSGDVLFTVKALTTVSSSKNSLSLVSAPALTKNGNNTISSASAAPTGANAWDGFIYTGGSTSGSSVKTFTGK